MNSSKKDNGIPSPEARANVFSKLFYWWTFPFFKNGYKHSVKLKDIYATISPDSSRNLGERLERHWFKEIETASKRNRKPSLEKAIFTSFYKSYLLVGILLLFHSAVIRLLQPVLLARYIYLLQKRSSESHDRERWLLGSAVVGVAVLNIIISHYCSLTCQRIGMRVRIACSSLIYRKLLRLNHQSLEQTTVGQLINLLSNDVQRFDVAAIYMHFLWIMPLHFALSFYIMYQSVGVAAAAGMLTVATQAILLQGYLSRLQGKLRYKIACKTDHRTKLLSEIISGMHLIKLYAWEKSFKRVVELARKTEIDSITRTSYIKGMSTGMMVFTERFILYLTLVTYVLLGNSLTGDIVFSLAQLFNIVQHYVAFMFPNALATYSEVRVSIRRIETYLLLEELVKKTDDNDVDDTGFVEMSNVDASWNGCQPSLCNLNLCIQPGTLCCVVGNVGSGKSSLLNLLIGELRACEGIMKISGKISYCSQEPWLFNSTVRNNIVFSNEYSRERYREVLRVCCLQTDLDQFRDRDKTLVGEKGVELSGGQKARINLARSVYPESDIYLLDDPLSAVDTHVANFLFEKCILNFLSRKTRILVTHQLQYLRQSDLIIVMNNGRVEHIGKFEQLPIHIITEICKEAPQMPVVDSKYARKLSIISQVSSIANDTAEEDHELIEKGGSTALVCSDYCVAGPRLWVLILLAVLFVIAQLASNSCDYLLRYWTNSEELTVQNVSNADDDNFIGHFRKEMLIMYSIFIATSIALTSSRSILYYKICMCISTHLHNRMLTSLMNAPIRFFNSNPSGRIMSRFSKDIGIIDEFLPSAALDAIQIFLVLCGILTMVFIVTPIMMVPAVFLLVIFYFCRAVYLSVAPDLKRFEGITKAPVFSHTSASFQGLPTIRSSDKEAVLVEEFDVLQDQHTSTWFLYLATNETFGFYLDVISIILLAFVTYQFLIFDGGLLSGNVGLVISQTLVLTGMLQFGVRQSAEVASNMVSVERVLQYTKLQDENIMNVETAQVKPPQSWPEHGRILFKNVHLGYSENQGYVLNNINLEIKAKEKVGIVGRTGAGKSSFIAALFRLFNFDGAILIDDVDISKIDLQKLRSSISVIPQDPILFSGTVRYNLDPVGKEQDDTLWEALASVNLKRIVDSLDQEVLEGGSNFSIGEKQLICLARAIVRSNKVLVMDEITSHVDIETDELIQRTVREKFKDCTVITIAHRLSTIIDSDKILFMDCGQAVEFDSPHALLQMPNGRFASLVQETGLHMEEKLHRQAREFHEINQSCR